MLEDLLTSKIYERIEYIYNGRNIMAVAPSAKHGLN
jgi:hypothetical protein